MTTNKKLAIFILGLTGSGKSRVANYLSQQGEFTLISGGSLLRGLVETEPEIEDARVAQEVMSKGIGAPNDLVVRLYRRALQQLKTPNVVFDGNPKDIEQFYELLDVLSEIGFYHPRVAAVWLDVPRPIVYQRIHARYICSKCGTVCDDNKAHCRCGGSLVRRLDDDRPEVIESKIQWFEKDVMPVIRDFQSKQMLLRVQATNDLNDIAKEIAGWVGNMV